MKKIILLLLIAVALISCKSTSPIITTKQATIETKKPVLVAINETAVYKSVRDQSNVIKQNPLEFSSPAEIKIDNDLKNTDTATTLLQDDIIAVAKENIGVRYITGGTSKSGFDCSGLVYATYGKFNIYVPRTSQEMSRFGTTVATSDAQKGDLIFFKTLGKKHINHVGMVVGVNDDEILFIHASIHKGVMISSTKDGYYKKTFAQLNRVLK